MTQEQLLDRQRLLSAEIGVIEGRLAQGRKALEDFKKLPEPMRSDMTAKIKADMAPDETLLANKKTELETVKSALNTNNTVSLNLSEKGVSNEALQIEAQAKATATLQSAEISAKATALALQEKATTDAQNSKSRNALFIGVAVVVTVVLLIVVIKIVNKKKANKSK